MTPESKYFLLFSSIAIPSFLFLINLCENRLKNICEAFQVGNYFNLEYWQKTENWQRYLFFLADTSKLVNYIKGIKDFANEPGIREGCGKKEVNTFNHFQEDIIKFSISKNISYFGIIVMVIIFIYYLINS